MSSWIRLSVVVFILSVTACSDVTNIPRKHPTTETEIIKGIDPNIVVGDVAVDDREALAQWIAEAVTLFQSPSFETNFHRASLIYPDVFVSSSQDIVPSSRLLKRLKTDDPFLSALWWPETFVIINGEPAVRSETRNTFGFEAQRNAGAGPFPIGTSKTKTGEIELGRLHFARYTRGDVVEKSCAMNTMIHEISHTLSEKPDQFWMHLLDSERGVKPPHGVFEASYFIGVIAQCTYLENKMRIKSDEFETCIVTFSDPSLSSRFRSIACDDFPNNTPITPENRLQP